MVKIIDNFESQAILLGLEKELKPKGITIKNNGILEVTLYTYVRQVIELNFEYFLFYLNSTGEKVLEFYLEEAILTRIIL